MTPVVAWLPAQCVGGRRQTCRHALPTASSLEAHMPTITGFTDAVAHRLLGSTHIWEVVRAGQSHSRAGDTKHQRVHILHYL